MSDIQLTSRDEELLKAILGEGIAEFEPQSRIEALLKRILDEGGMGGGGTRILGYYATLEQLEAAHPTGHINDAYLVGTPSHIYVWLPDAQEWHDSGQFEAIPGEPGVGIASIVKTATVGLVDTYTITYDDLRTTTFEITNGQNGTDGRDGTDGNGIASIAKTATAGLVDTYTITFTNGQTTTFNVTNGQNGTNGTDGRDGIDGTDGISVVSVTINASDHLIVTLSNGNTQDAGRIPASNGYPLP